MSVASAVCDDDASVASESSESTVKGDTAHQARLLGSGGFDSDMDTDGKQPSNSYQEHLLMPIDQAPSSAGGTTTVSIEAMAEAAMTLVEPRPPFTTDKEGLQRLTDWHKRNAHAIREHAQRIDRLKRNGQREAGAAEARAWMKPDPAVVAMGKLDGVTYAEGMAWYERLATRNGKDWAGWLQKYGHGLPPVSLRRPSFLRSRGRSFNLSCAPRLRTQESNPRCVRKVANRHGTFTMATSQWDDPLLLYTDRVRTRSG
ncbi:MAG: hypothetical protein LQ338_003088 [Usnochroma carphineum]|nr:MAG: hypothetical protein LQ338_003088 [Usnochroma carphineum]